MSFYVGTDPIERLRDIVADIASSYSRPNGVGGLRNHSVIAPTDVQRRKLARARAGVQNAVNRAPRVNAANKRSVMCEILESARIETRRYPQYIGKYTMRSGWKLGRLTQEYRSKGGLILKKGDIVIFKVRPVNVRFGRVKFYAPRAGVDCSCEPYQIQEV